MLQSSDWLKSQGDLWQEARGKLGCHCYIKIKTFIYCLVNLVIVNKSLCVQFLIIVDELLLYFLQITYSISRNCYYILSYLQFDLRIRPGIVQFKFTSIANNGTKTKSTKCLYRVHQKNACSEHAWFFYPKNLTIGSGIDQNKKLPSFLHEKLQFSKARDKFHFWPMTRASG